MKVDRVKTFNVYDILPLIRGPGNNRKSKKVKLNNIEVNVSSVTLLTFKKSGTTCKICKLKAEYFALEKRISDEVYHLSLYGKKNGKEILMTSDHIYPKSKCGSDGINNRQTLCEVCNNKKADSILTNDINQILIHTTKYYNKILQNNSWNTINVLTEI
jgi:hypothetical protein